jgi:hypothetical protein
VSWPIGSRWLRRESLADGSRGYPQNPSPLREASASASSTSSPLMGQSLRTRKSTQLSAVQKVWIGGSRAQAPGFQPGSES